MEDIISTMPSNIIELILTCLPIADVVRTSILSSKWRYQWCNTPHLIFNKQSVSVSLQHKLEGIIDQLLLLHNGPIHKFSFEASSDLKDIACVNRWMVFLSRNNVKELYLKFSSGRLYKLPTALYLCESLVSLNLHECEIWLSSSFNGFNCLTNLFLENVCISDIDFASLISKCPILRKLVFIDFYCCRHVKLNAPRLQELVVDGVYTDIHLENTPDLAILSLQLEDDEDFEREIDKVEECFFTKSLGSILKIEMLMLQLNFLDFMTRGPTFVQFPTYRYLKSVFLGCLNFEDLKHVVALQSLLQNAPVLTDIEIESDSDKSIAAMPTSSFSFFDNGSHTFSLEQLRRVKLVELLGVRSELEFIEFILATALTLESLTVKLDCEVHDEIKVYKEIARFRRASARAEIVILG